MTNCCTSIFLKKSAILSVSPLLFFIMSESLAVTFARLFSDRNAEIAALTVHSFRIGAFSLIAMGVTMFIPSLFTGLNNGLVSGVLTAFEMLIFPTVTLLVLDRALGLKGVWYSLPASWFLSCLLCILVTRKNRKQYHF